MAAPNGSALAVRESPPVQAPATAHRGVALNNMNDLARFAQCVADSGLAPKDFRTPQAIAIAVQHGLELGLAPLQSLHSIAVINGKPGIYGDAAKALVEASGLLADFEEYFEQAGKRLTGNPTTYTDDTAAVCVSQRAGRKHPTVTRFTVGDAKRASLWGKGGPWTQYPARMLQFRARGFNLRDGFADVLKGIKTVEELQDYPTDAAPAPRVQVEMMKPAEAPATDEPAIVTPSQAEELETLIRLAGPDCEEKFFREYQVTNLAEFPALHYEAAKARLEKYIAKKQATQPQEA